MINKKTNGDIPADLLAVRKQINDVDKQIITLLAERSELSRKACVVKKKNNIDIVDVDRETKASEMRDGIARNKRIDPTFVRDVFSVIVLNSRRLQHEMK